MALEQLQAPVAITFGDAPVHFLNQRALWHDALGFVGSIYPGTGLHGVVVQLDGVASLRNSKPISGTTTHNLETGGLACFDSIGQAFHLDVDMRILRPRGAGTTATVARKPWTPVDGRYLRARNGKLYAWDGAASSDEVEATLAAGIVGDGWISPGRGGRTIFVGFGDGSIRLYDLVAHEVIGNVRRLGVACVYVGYAPALGVFVSVHRDVEAPYTDRIAVWADEVRPDSIADPEEVTALRAGFVATLRTRVLGADNDPVEGILVDWSIEEPATMIDAQSMTDADGYAAARAYVLAGDGGTVTAAVEVKF